MKNTMKKMGLMALLAGTTWVNAQAVQDPNSTGFGSQNGVAVSSTTNPNGGTFIGFKAGRVGTGSSVGSNENNTYLGHLSGELNNKGNDNTFAGSQAGNGNQADRNVFIGSAAGFLNTNINADDNTFVGFSAGRSNTSGTANIFLGSNAGFSNTSAGYNIFVGFQAGYTTSTGGANVFMGHGAGLANVSGWGNTFLGFGAGLNSTGSQNVFLGGNAGANETGNGQLYIDVSNTANPLVWGDFYNRMLKFNGKVGIGVGSSGGFGPFPTTAGTINVQNYNLYVRGGILTEEVRVNLANSGGNWADYVFEKNYDLKPLAEVEKFIVENGHLPNVPSAKQVKEEGIELGNIAKIQQEKIEEITLYLIQQQKEIEALKAEVARLKEKQ